MMNQSTTGRVTHEQISERAKALWRERGQPSAQDDEIWYEAERQLNEEAQRPAAAAPQSAAPSPSTPVGVGAMTTAPQAQAPAPAASAKPAAKKRGKARA